MIYLLFVLSLTANCVLIWYIRTLIKKYLFDVESVNKFKEMLEQYADSLTSLYRMDEVYGDENIKKTINQTKFVIDACKEFQGSLSEFGEEPVIKEDSEESEKKEQNIIRIRDGERVTQDASSYKRIVIDQ